jgi:hypothetical protein
MRIARGKKSIGAWNYGVQYLKSPWGSSARVFEFWFFKLLSIPREGEALTPANYKGFLVTKLVYPNIVFRRYQFRFFAIWVPIKISCTFV